MRLRGSGLTPAEDGSPGELIDESNPSRSDSPHSVDARLVAAAARETVEVTIKYSEALERQRRTVAKLNASGTVRLPLDLDYANVNGLSAEEVEKLSINRPQTMSEARLISGFTPAGESRGTFGCTRHILTHPNPRTNADANVDKTLIVPRVLGATRLLEYLSRRNTSKRKARARAAEERV